MLAGLRLAHRLFGLTVSLWLLLLGATGALLVFKDDWLRLTQPVTAGPSPDAQAATPSGLARRARAAEVAFGADRIRAMVFAGPSIALDQVYLRDHAGGGYLDPQTGAIVARWDGAERLVDVLFDLHDALLLGEKGKKAVGIVGLLGVMLVQSGLVLAWPALWHARGSVWPRSTTRSGLVVAHRELGLIAALPLLVIMLSGAAVIFPTTARVLLGGDSRLSISARTPATSSGLSDTAWQTVFSAALVRFPEAPPRAITWPKPPDTAIAVRLRQPTEWHPTGRTTVLATAAGNVIATLDAAAAPLPDRLVNAAYPVHAGKVGGPLYRSLVALAGLALALLSSYSAIAYARHLFGGLGRRKARPASLG